MELTLADLLELASRIAGSALPGEEVEAYASWQRGTDVRAYVGDVESLSSAESSGIGIRVVKGGRQGFAYVGTLDERLAREALEEARDNAGFASVDENVGLASPDGVEPAELELWDERLERETTESKIELALELEKRTRGGDPRIREVVNADYGDDLRETAIASSTGISAVSRRTSCFLSTHAVAGDRDDTQTGWGYAVGRSIEDLDVEKAANAAVVRATRMIGATKPKSQNVVVVLDREITASLLGIIASTLSGEEVAKGRSLFEDKLGEQVAASFVNIVDDPDQPACLRVRPVRRRGPCLSAQLSDRPRDTRRGTCMTPTRPGSPRQFPRRRRCGRASSRPLRSGRERWPSSPAHLIKPGY